MAWVNGGEGYPPEAKELARHLLTQNLSINEVVAKMRATYPTIVRQTISNWGIADEAFGILYRQALAGKAQSIITDSMEQLEDVYDRTNTMLNSDEPIDEKKATLLRLMKDTANDKQKTAIMLLGKINKHYGDNIKQTHGFENAPLVELVVTKPVAEGLSSLEKLQNGGD
jgi:hypothetical protein